LKEIYLHTGGHPRKIINACHSLLIEMLIQEKKVISKQFVEEVLSNSSKLNHSVKQDKKMACLVILLMVTAFLAGIFLTLDEINKKDLLDYLKSGIPTSQDGVE